MTAATQLYLASTDQANSAPSGGWWANRRAYNYEGYWQNQSYGDKSETLRLLATGSTFTVDTNANWNGGDRQLINLPDMMKNSSGSTQNYARLYWKVQTNYWNTCGLGPYWEINGTNIDKNKWCHFHPNVVGATFTWRKDTSYWSDGECGFKSWGLNYYSPSRDLWRAVRFNTHSSSGNHYTSQEGDDWVHHGGNPAALGTKVDGWKATRGYLGTSNRNYVMTQDWLWGGLWITGECTSRGGSSRERQLDISDFQPIYGNAGNSTKLVLPNAERRFSSDDFDPLLHSWVT